LVGLGEPKLYHNSGENYKKWGFLLGDCLTYEELSGGYSQEMMGLMGEILLGGRIEYEFKC
jgi:hypothetical protein